MAKHLSPIFKGFRGSVNRQLVFKQMRGSTVVTAFPDRRNVIFSERQREKHRKFSFAVGFARTIISNPDLKRTYSIKASLLNFRSAWNLAIAEYMSGGELKLKPKKIRFDKRIITQDMGNEIHINLSMPCRPDYINSGIQTGEAPARLKSLFRRSIGYKIPFRPPAPREDELSSLALNLNSLP